MIAPGRHEISCMKDWITQAMALVRGARHGPVGVVEARKVWPIRELGTPGRGTLRSPCSALALGCLPSPETVMKWSDQATSLPFASTAPFIWWKPPGR